jgi:four helix bundle protein
MKSEGKLKEQSSTTSEKTQLGERRKDVAHPGGQTSGGPRKVFDLEDRLLEFASEITDISENLPDTRAGKHVACQLLRSGTSPFSNHGEAESAESPEDVIHKLKVCLKELRETRRWLRLIDHKRWQPVNVNLQASMAEPEELICIFVASIRTAQRNRNRGVPLIREAQ